MQLNLARSQIFKALAACIRIVERRTTIPILSNLLLTAADGTLTLTATDLDMVMTVPIEADIAQAGATTVPAATLHDIVRKLPDGAQVALEASGSQMVVRAGRARFTLNTLPAADYPDFPTRDVPARFEIAADTMASAFRRCSFAISTEETRYYLNGIYLHALDVDGEPMLRCVATDGHRLARIDTRQPEGAREMPGVIVPRKTVAEILRLAEAAEGALAVDIADTQIRVTAGGIRLTSKVIDGTFPDYERVIPRDGDKRCTVDRAVLAAAVDRVATVSAERGRAVKITLADGAARLAVIGPDVGQADEEVEVAYEGQPIEIGFNNRYLGEILGTLTGPQVALTVSSPGAPALVTAPDAPDAIFVLMPMRV